MKILFVSALTSPSLLDNLSAKSGKNLGFAVQKFSRLIAQGFMRNGAHVRTLTALPISRQVSRKLFWNMPTEEENGVVYHYIPFINLSGFRHVCLFLYSFFYTLFWGMTNRQEKCIVCDVLNVSICMGSLLASKLNGLKSVGVMTDMPGLMVSQQVGEKQKKVGLASSINKSYLTSFSCYVFLTEQMNVAVNRKKRPFIVMEGLVDENMHQFMEKTVKTQKRVLLYAGGLHERYGLKKLVEAFMLVNGDDLQLSLYGNGPFVEDLKVYSGKDNRIIYHGIVPNKLVVEAELQATLLINPRPTDEEFTQYSFPSKNMEYMVAGTPLLTTKLPGMPAEYHDYVYLFEDETIEGYAETLRSVLLLPVGELNSMGLRAKAFVLQKKNNVIQAARILELVHAL